MSDTSKRCRWLIRPHRWSRWRQGEIKGKTTGTTLELVQKRTCERCGKAQMEVVW